MITKFGYLEGVNADGKFVSLIVVSTDSKKVNQSSIKIKKK